MMKLYQKMRRIRFGKPTRREPLLVSAVNCPLSHYHMCNFLHKAILSMNVKLKMNMVPFHYTPHALRTGGTTDLYGSQLLYIQSFGRWDKEWQDTYVNLDFRFSSIKERNCDILRHSMAHSIPIPL